MRLQNGVANLSVMEEVNGLRRIHEKSVTKHAVAKFDLNMIRCTNQISERNKKKDDIPVWARGYDALMIWLMVLPLLL
jgi:hypothetical protein